jgi:hypothetical protein
MIALKREMGLQDISAKSKNSSKFPRAKFGIFGEELIEKEVKPRGNSGRIYLPSNWVGKRVKIIRID